MHFIRYNAIKKAVKQTFSVNFTAFSYSGLSFLKN